MTIKEKATTKARESKNRLIHILNSRDLLENLAEEFKNPEFLEPKKSQLKMIKYCMLANHIPVWIWHEMSKENEKYCPKEKNFIEACRKQNEFYNIIKNIANAAKHVHLSHDSSTKSIENFVNFDPGFQYHMQTGKELEKDAHGNYMCESISVNTNLSEIFVTYKDSGNQKKTTTFAYIMEECIKYLEILCNQCLT